MKRKPKAQKVAWDPIPFLVDLLRHAPPPGTTLHEALLRNQAIQNRLAEMMLVCADMRWPGFRALADKIAQDERSIRQVLDAEQPDA